MEALINEWLSYDKATGRFHWKKSPNNNVKESSMAGCIDCKDGYVLIRLKNRLFRAHRIVWELFNGPIPEKKEIDHINGIRSDNRIENLRLVNRSENNQNRKRARSDSKTGRIGVGYHKSSGLYLARIRLNGTSQTIGYFKDIEDASNAYLKRKREIHLTNTL